MSKKIDFKELPNDELISNYVNFKSELFGLRFQLSVGQLTDTNKIVLAKKNIARALTEMTKRGINANAIKMPVVKKAKKVSKKSKPKEVKQEKKTITKVEKTEQENKIATVKKEEPKVKAVAKKSAGAAPVKKAQKGV